MDAEAPPQSKLRDANSDFEGMLLWMVQHVYVRRFDTAEPDAGEGNTKPTTRQRATRTLSQRRQRQSVSVD